MIKVEELQHWHIDSIKAREVFKHENIERLRSSVNNDSVFAAALVVDEVVVAIVGGFLMWNGVADVWAVTTDHLPKYAKSVHAQVKNLIEVSIRHHNLHRMEASVRADYEVGQRWLERLGFEQESLMKKYGPDGSDYFLYARFE